MSVTLIRVMLEGVSQKMIVQITGNVAFDITLDPSVWIFDERKVLFDHIFDQPQQNDQKKEEKSLDQTYDEKINPPVNKNITRDEQEKILKNSYAMPLREFLEYAEVKDQAKKVRLETNFGEKVVPLDLMYDCYMLFSIQGKPLKESGPVHIYFHDGSNKEDPIKGVTKIIVE